MNFTLFKVASRKSQVASLVLTASLSLGVFTACNQETMTGIEKNTPTSLSTMTSGRKENPTELPVAINGRLAFKTAYDLIAFQKQVFGKELTEQKKIEDAMNYASLQTFVHENPETYSLMETVPFTLAGILNKEAEVQLGDSVFWYNNGNVYAVHKEDATRNLQKIKKNSSVVKPSTTYQTQRIAAQRPEMSVVLDPNASSPDARYQKEYLTNGSSNDKRKIVYEVYYQANSFYNPQLGLVWSHSIYTTAKLEYEGQCGSWPFREKCWRPAGEQRIVTINPTISGSIVWKKSGVLVGSWQVTPNIVPIFDRSTTSDIAVSLFATASGGTDGVNPSFSGTIQGLYSTRVTAPNNTAGVYIINANW